MTIGLHVGGAIEVAGAEIAIAPTRALLAAVSETGSVQGAARRLGVSYRSAWGRIAALESALGRPVAVKTKGHGSALTPLGAALSEALGATLDRLGPALAAEQAALDRALGALLAPAPAPAPARLRLAVSHDALLLDALADMPEIEVTTAGSADALARLAAGLADVAGFHFGAAEPAPGSAFAHVFADPTLRVRPVFAREQGLMLAPGNPLRIGGVADIADRRARFVNRQRGAGTRIWFDRLCREAAVPPDAILGYGTEEFTHQAVAALIASGAADVGMGARAVADRFGLAFLSLGAETYFFATRPDDDGARVERVIAAVRERAGIIVGYKPTQ